jgi:beta-glucosidase
MPGPAKYYGSLLAQAVRNWQIDEAKVDDAVRRILRMIIKSGKMDDAPLAEGSVNTTEHQALARELAEASITLLKNESDLLPLKDVATVAVIGPNATEARIGGGGSSYLEPPYRVSPLDGLKAKLGDGVEIAFTQGCDNYSELPALKPNLDAPGGGTGHGFWGSYFNNTELAGEPAAQRLDLYLNDWRLHPPEGIDDKAYSVRWEGTIEVMESGRYTFKVRNSGTCRLYLNGEQLLETTPEQAPADHPVANAAAHVELKTDKAYQVTVEYIKPEDMPLHELRVLFAYDPDPEQDTRIDDAVALAEASDVAVIFAGMPQGFESEGRDRPHMKLPGRQDALISAVAAANPQTVVVLNVGSPVEMPWVDDVASIVLAYYPGQEGGSAVANVLTGAVNPSGKLPVTFPKRYEDNPTYINYPGWRDVRYGEGLFVGYRYYDKKNVEPLFPFGFGLTYTSFDYSDLEVASKVSHGETLTVSVAVTNTGEVAGQEVVQLYVADKASSLVRPMKELKGFQKVALEPGERRCVTFTLDQRALSFYDPYEAKDWVAEPGEFEVLVGSSAQDIRARATFMLA